MVAGRFVRRVLGSRAAGALALLAAWSSVIALATASRPPDGRWLGMPSLGTVAVGLMVPVLAAGAVLLVVGLIGPRTQRSGPPVRRSLWPTLVLLALVVLFAILGPRPGTGDDPVDPAPAEALDEGATPGRRVAPSSTELVVLAALDAVAAAVVAASRRRPDRPAPAAEPSQPDVLPAVEGARRVLRLGGGPRHAVLAAYAALEAGFAAAGLPRRPSETPTEHTRRALAAHPVDAGAVAELAGLYERARYSGRPVTTADRDRALAALDRTDVTAP